jgi:hypothetical protein
VAIDTADRIHTILDLHCSSLSYGQTPLGSIRGAVLSESTEEPITGANIVVLDTNLGAAADVDGRFVITGVPVGTYQSAIGILPSIGVSAEF